MRPILFEIFGYPVYSYPLIVGITWGLAFRYYLKVLKDFNCQTENYNFFFFGAFIFSWVGAKLLFLVTSVNNLDHLSQAYFWTGGGFVFYGGVIGGLFFTLIYSVYLKKFDPQNLKYLIPVLLIGHGLGRVACFMAGCCFGSECDLPFAVFMHGKFRHPVQLYESLFLGVMGFFFLRVMKKKSISTLRTVLMYLYIYGIGRFVLEFFRGDKVRGESFGLSTSQSISILFLTLALITEIWLWAKKKHQT